MPGVIALWLALAFLLGVGVGAWLGARVMRNVAGEIVALAAGTPERLDELARELSLRMARRQERAWRVRP